MWLLPATPKYENKASVPVYKIARNAVNIMRSSQEIHLVKKLGINNTNRGMLPRKWTSGKKKKRGAVFSSLCCTKEEKPIAN